MDNIEVIDRSKVHKVFSGRWISVEDRLPGDGVYVLVAWAPADGSEPEVMKARYHEAVGQWSPQIARRGSVTHWMPLPEPPEEE